MSYDYPTTYSTNGSSLETASLARPNQLNYTNFGCGYDCGWGCHVPYENVPYEEEPNGDGEAEDEDDGGSETDTISTLIGDEEALTAEYQPRDMHDDETYGQGGLLDPENLEDGHVRDVQDIFSETGNTFHYSLPSAEFDDQPESLDVEPCATREHSTVPSRGSSVRSQSPMPEPEYWLRGVHPIQLPSIQPAPIPLRTKYLFSKSPLRLSPQCRGHPTDMPYWDDMGDWRS